MAGPLQQAGASVPTVLQALLDNTDTHLAYLDLHFRFVAVNARYARGSGYSSQELIGRDHFELFPHAENQAIFEHVRATGEPAVYRAKPFVFPDRPELGTTYWDWSLTPARDESGKIVGFAFSLHDVTEQTRAGQALRESEARYKQLFMSMSEGFALLEVIYDERGQAVDHRYLAANPAFGELTGVDPTTIIGKRQREVFPNTSEAWIAACAEVVQTGQPVQIRDFAGVVEPWYEGTVFRPAPGQFATVFANVTERLRGALDSMLDAYVLMSPVRDADDGIMDFRVEYANPAACQSMGVECHRLVGRTARDSFPHLAQTGMLDQFRRVLERGEPLVIEDYEYEDEQTGQRQVRFFDVRVNALTNGVAVAWRDVTDRVQATQVLRESRERVLAYSRQLVEAIEGERRAIARELHDEAGQALTAIKVGLSLFEHHSGSAPELAAHAADLRKIVDDVMSGLHNLSSRLRPGVLDQVGLVAAVEQHVQRVRDQHRIDIEVVGVSMEGGRLPPQVETNLYRIVQECLTNVVRHAQATHVDIVLQRQERCCTLIVEDNGRGFDPSKIADSGRLGMIGIRERAESLGGTLIVESVPGSGTSIHVSVPLDGAAEPCDRSI